MSEHVCDGGWACHLHDEKVAKQKAAAPELLSLVQSAVDVLQRHLPPDGLSDHEALNELYGIFDGPEYRAAMKRCR